MYVDYQPNTGRDGVLVTVSEPTYAQGLILPNGRPDPRNEDVSERERHTLPLIRGTLGITSPPNSKGPLSVIVTSQKHVICYDSNN